MGGERWRPRVTVAAVVEQGGRYLLVEERDAGRLMLNNPAGHLDEGETLLQAVVREVREETARDFVPEALVGVYLARREPPGGGEAVTYLRFAFTGRVGEPLPGLALDAPVERTLWLGIEALRAQSARHRSPVLMRCVDDHAAGRRYPLELLQSALDGRWPA